MSRIKKIKDGFFRQLGTTTALLVMALVGWALSQLAPIILPVVVRALPNRAFIAILLLSIIINVVLAIAVWQLAKPKSDLKPIYGILWDTAGNPHCPVCKSGGLQYGKWNYAGKDVGYHCNKCNDVFRLATASGQRMEPEDALRLI